MIQSTRTLSKYWQKPSKLSPVSHLVYPQAPACALTTSIYDLPDEIYEKIFAYCPNHDLYHVSLAAQRLFNVSIRILYRIIPKMDVSRTIDFLIAVCFYKHRAPLVWSLNIPFAKNAITESLSKREILRHLRKLGNPLKVIPFGSVLRDYMTLLTTTLKKLTNLRLLELRLVYSDGRDNNVARLLGQTTFQLRTFITNLECNSAMGRFLQTQTRLRELQCPTSLTATIRDKNLLPPGSLPNLGVITWNTKAPMDVIRYIIKGRPVDRIIVIILDAEFTRVTPFIDVGPQSESIKKTFFVFHSLQVSSAHITEIAMQFPALYELGLKVEDLSQEFIDEVAASIHNFRSLRRLAVAGTKELEEGREAVYRPHFDACFRNCKSLLFIVTPAMKNGSFTYHIVWR